MQSVGLLRKNLEKNILKRQFWKKKSRFFSHNPQFASSKLPFSIVEITNFLEPNRNLLIVKRHLTSSQVAFYYAHIAWAR